VPNCPRPSTRPSVYTVHTSCARIHLKYGGDCGPPVPPAPEHAAQRMHAVRVLRARIPDRRKLWTGRTARARARGPTRTQCACPARPHPPRVRHLQDRPALADSSAARRTRCACPACKSLSARHARLRPCVFRRACAAALRRPTFMPVRTGTDHPPHGRICKPLIASTRCGCSTRAPARPAQQQSYGAARPMHAPRVAGAQRRPGRCPGACRGSCSAAPSPVAPALALPKASPADRVWPCCGVQLRVMATRTSNSSRTESAALRSASTGGTGLQLRELPAHQTPQQGRCLAHGSPERATRTEQGGTGR